MQDLPRLHVAAELAVPGAALALSEARAHYLAHVLRRRVGDRVLVFNECHGEWLAVIDGLHRNRCGVRLLERVRPAAAEPGPILCFAPLKRDATDLVVRMATELGVAALRPVATERTNALRVNAERWALIAAEAAEQCERLSVPAIAPPVRLEELLGAWDRARPLLAAIERAGDRGGGPVGTIAAWRAGHGRAVRPGLLVGPEGGFSPGEVERLRAHPSVVAVSLGPLVLRAETASLAALAALLP